MVDPRAALDWIKTLEADAQQRWQPGMLLAAIAEYDPAEALDLALELEDEADGVQRVLATWATNDPRAVSAWLRGSSREVRGVVYSSLAHSYVDVDLDEHWIGCTSSRRHDSGR